MPRAVHCALGGTLLRRTRPREPYKFEALEKVLCRCDGLPLALSVAGGAVRGLMKDAQEERRQKSSVHGQRFVLC